MNEKVELKELVTKLKDQSKNIERVLDDLRERRLKPVVHGQWIGSADGYADGELVYDMWECSNCGYDADGAEEKPDWKFCPMCGADMREEG